MTHKSFTGTAIITAGGRSSRFGSDKAVAEWRGQSLLSHVAASLQTARQRVLVAPAGRYTLPGWQCLPDQRPGDGPLAGLELALTVADDEWVAFAGVDQPALNEQYWRLLASARHSGCLCVQAVDPQGHPQPLAALYHRDLLPGIKALLDSGERRLRLACPKDQIEKVPGLAPYFFHNINRPEDLARLEREQENDQQVIFPRRSY